MVCKVTSGLLLEPLIEELQELQILNQDALKAVLTIPIFVSQFDILILFFSVAF